MSLLDTPGHPSRLAVGLIGLRLMFASAVTARALRVSTSLQSARVSGSDSREFGGWSSSRTPTRGRRDSRWPWPVSCPGAESINAIQRIVCASLSIALATSHLASRPTVSGAEGDIRLVEMRMTRARPALSAVQGARHPRFSGRVCVADARIKTHVDASSPCQMMRLTSSQIAIHAA